MATRSRGWRDWAGPDLVALAGRGIAAQGAVLAVGIATVDRERAARSPGAPRFRPAPADATLGAFALAATLPDGVTLLLLEPSTEGRLAAFLARHGEGPAALYVSGPPLAAAGSGSPLGRPARLAEAGGRDGPYLLLVAPGPFDTRRGRVPSAGMESAAVEIRAADAADAEAIAALFTDEGYPAGPSDVVARLAAFSPPGSAVRVAVSRGEVVGFVAFHLLPRFEHSDRIARVVALVVDAGARERGLGHRLMAEVERDAVAAGCAYVEVTAGHHRPDALQLYEALGYQAGVVAYLRKRL